MKTIQLTHEGNRLDLSEGQAVGLFHALEEALASAGVDPQRHATLKAPCSVQSFSQDPKTGEHLTDY